MTRSLVDLAGLVPGMHVRIGVHGAPPVVGEVVTLMRDGRLVVRAHGLATNVIGRAHEIETLERVDLTPAEVSLVAQRQREGTPGTSFGSLRKARK